MLPYNQDVYYEEEESGGCITDQSHLQVEEALKRCQEFLLSQQHPQGYWWAQTDSNASVTAYTVLLLKILGMEDKYPVGKMEKYIRRNQRSHGGWELFYGDGGDLSVTIDSYMALRLLNVPSTDPALHKALQFILHRGGVTKSGPFTKIFMALLGCFDWKEIPSLPPWVMLLPCWFPVTIYEMSSCARNCMVPLMVVLNKKPVYRVSPKVSFDELYAPVIPTPLQAANWPMDNIFAMVDWVLRISARWALVPFRRRGLEAAEKWVLERQEHTGDWAGLFHATFYSMLCLKTLGYEATDPVMHRGLLAIKELSIETADEYWVQPSVSPVWDTALIVRALVESGMAPDHPALQRAGEWLLKKQTLLLGDWSVRNRSGRAGGWAFEFGNRWCPDVDDSAAVVMALNVLKLPNEDVKHGSILRCVKWISSMHCRAGGWAAFDKDNDQAWLNSMVVGLVDPNTVYITARVLEMVGRLMPGGVHDRGALPSAELISRALAYLRKEQEREGCWFGRWGVNYIYGTYGALVALSLVAPSTHRQEIAMGARWLVRVQHTHENGDGGWGETCDSYKDPTLKGRGDASTPSQTAWAVMGLLAAGDALGTYEIASIEHGVKYLLSTQRKDGTWHEPQFTGTGLPGHFYHRYHFYAQHFTLTALARYRSRLQAAKSSTPLCF